MTRPTVTRRTALQLVGGAGIVTAAAACTSGGTPSGRTSSADGSASTTTSTTPTTAPSSASAPNYAALSAKLSRPLVRPGASTYASAWQLYNPRFDSLTGPAAVARVSSANDVAECVRFAADARAPIALRSGGHSYGGWSTGSGLVVDTRGLAGVDIDSAGKTVKIGAGASLVAVYTALAARGVAIAAGSCPTVGITGLALGGGVGVLARAYGLTCDSITSVDIVTADGRQRTVSSSADPDLFWALRGGGAGSFGAVTALTMSLRAAPTVTNFFYEFDFGSAATVVAAWQSWIASQPAGLWSTCKLLADAAGSALHATVSGTWIGAAGALTAQLQPLLNQLPAPTDRYTSTRDYGSAMLAEAGCAGQSVASCTTAALSAPKRQPFAATSSIVNSAIPSAGLSAAVTWTRKALSVPGIFEGGVSFDALGGAVAGVGATATPFPYRSALASVQYTATWPAGASAVPTAAAPFDSYVRGFRAAMTPWLGTSAYVNYADASISDYGTAYWGANYARLQQVKKTYDPDNLFTFAQSVRA